MLNQLFYGDNLEVLRNYIADESVDLIYIDPPFNSKRNYNQIYNNIEAKSQAFTDIWFWNNDSEKDFEEIISNKNQLYTNQSINLILGLEKVLGKESLLAYLVSLTQRISEMYRILKNSGSFYLHCDPTASHYLKLVLDSIFCSRGGSFLNEIIWHYNTGGVGKKWFARKHDVIFFYSKGKSYQFYPERIKIDRTQEVLRRIRTGNENATRSKGEQKLPEDVFVVQAINSMAKERLGYPTQKSENLLERIILASSNENDIVLDAYAGSGTSLVVAQKLKRYFIGIDDSPISMEIIQKRFENSKIFYNFVSLNV